MLRSMQTSSYPSSEILNWKTTPYWLSLTAYSLYSQLPSMLWSRGNSSQYSVWLHTGRPGSVPGGGNGFFF